MLRWHAKLICGVIMFIVMPICFLLPVKMVHTFTRWGARGQLFLDLLSCFAGGVFLSSYLVFMAPAVRMLIEENLMKPNRIDYPLPDMIIGLGFFIMLLLDKAVNLVINSSNKKEKTAEPDHGRKRTRSTSSQQVMPSESGIRLVDQGFEQEQDGFENGDIEMVQEVVRRPPKESNVSNGGNLSNGGGNSDTLTRRQSYVEASNVSPESMSRSIVMMMALSTDSVLEGMTIGLKKTMVEVWAIFIGIIVHESVIAFCLGLQLIRVHRRVAPVLVASIVYTLMNPIGVLIATCIYESVENDPGMEAANGILQALTSGCFIYIIFYEILEGQITQNTPLAKIFAIFVGYAFLSSFAAIPGSGPYNFSSPEKIPECRNGTLHGNHTV